MGTFTILRDPVERVLSVIKHLKKYGYKICTNELKYYLRVEDCMPPRPQVFHEKLHSYLRNGVAFQWGDYLNEPKRTTQPQEAVALAKEVLRNMTFIGFYEDWETDYYGLQAAIFPDFDEDTDVQKSWWQRPVVAFRRVLFYWGTLIARARMRTRKYAAQVTSPEDWKLLRESTRYDQEVYDYARTLTGRPVDPFYTDYAEFARREGPSMLAHLGFLLCLCFGCCRLCCYLKGCICNSLREAMSSSCTSCSAR